MYKLRFYNEKGNFDHEEIFSGPFKMIERYKEVFVFYSATNPTAWYKYDDINNEWCRLSGF